MDRGRRDRLGGTGTRAARRVDAAADPVAAVLDAHERGELIALRTSGTTSAPRAVVRTTGSWVDSFPHVSRLTGIDGTARVWVPGPLSATMNLFAAVHARYVRATVVDAPDGATHAHLTPALLRAALHDGTDLAGIHVVVAGDRLPRDLAGQAQAAGARISHYYGAAELSFVAWGTHEEDLRPFPGVEVEVRDGVLWVRSPYLSHGYDGAEGPFTVAADGFATVGDRGRLEGGVLTVVGRGTEVVLTGGATVLVADVELGLRQVGVRDVVVVGVPHRRLGSIVAAVVSDVAVADRARESARTALSSVQRPRLWFHLPQFPLTAGGKVDRAAVAALAAARATAARARGRPVSPDDAPVLIAAQRTPIGTAGHSLAALTAADLAAPVIRALADAARARRTAGHPRGRPRQLHGTRRRRRPGRGAAGRAPGRRPRAHRRPAVRQRPGRRRRSPSRRCAPSRASSWPGEWSPPPPRPGAPGRRPTAGCRPASSGPRWRPPAGPTRTWGRPPTCSPASTASRAARRTSTPRARTPARSPPSRPAGSPPRSSRSPASPPTTGPAPA